MTSSRSQHGLAAWKWSFAALLAIVVLGASLAGADASGNSRMSGRDRGGMGGSGGGMACESDTGKALYDCLASRLDYKASRITGGNEVEPARSAMHTAAAQLRSATSKAQALSAIAQCRSVVLGVLAKVRGIGSSGGASGLEAAANVLSRAAALIQAKG
jgi:hypothetical protein